MTIITMPIINTLAINSHCQYYSHYTNITVWSVTLTILTTVRPAHPRPLPLRPRPTLLRLWASKFATKNNKSDTKLLIETNDTMKAC